MRDLFSALKPQLKTIGLVYLIWTALAVLFAVQGHTNALLDGTGTKITLFKAIELTVVNYWMYGLATLPAIWFGVRFRFTRDRWMVATAVHGGVFLLGSLFYSLIRGFLFPIANSITGEMGPRSFYLAKSVFGHTLYTFLWMYCGVLLATNAIYYYRQNRERELRASQLQTLLSQAQLQLLKSQLQPHFIFNTLHAISTLMARDVAGARLMIVRLSELLRMALERFEAQELSFKEELEFITNYLEIERIRFEDRLSVHINVSPDVLDAMVPALLLQPLVENAVRHGISVQSKPGSISIYGKQNAGELEIIISDNGPGPGPNFNAGGGVGIANTRARLQKLYGQDFAFDLSARAGSGLEVLIKIPIHFDPLARASDPVELHQIA